MLEWSPSAFEDREAIFDYIAAESPKAAAIMDAAISRQVERLLAHPQSGRMGLVPGTRELPMWRDKLDWKERQSGLEKSAEARG